MTELERHLSITVGVLAVVLAGLGWRNWRLAREVCRLRERCTHEASSHYLTYTRLLGRERQLGTLAKRLRGLGEIATASAIGAQLYQALLAELHEPSTTADEASPSVAD